MNEEDLAQRLLQRLEYLLDKILFSYCNEENDGVWAKGTFEENSRGGPARTSATTANASYRTPTRTWKESNLAEVSHVIDLGKGFAYPPSGCAR